MIPNDQNQSRIDPYSKNKLDNKKLNKMLDEKVSIRWAGRTLEVLKNDEWIQLSGMDSISAYIILQSNKLQSLQTELEEQKAKYRRLVNAHEKRKKENQQLREYVDYIYESENVESFEDWLERLNPKK